MHWSLKKKIEVYADFYSTLFLLVLKICCRQPSSQIFASHGFSVNFAPHECLTSLWEVEWTCRKPFASVDAHVNKLK